MQSLDAKFDETELLKLLRQRDEMAFTQLVELYHASLVRLAQIYVQDVPIAEEVTQETWLAVLNGLDRFEGRSSLKTWIFTILTNKAKTRSQRENRTISYTEMEDSFRNTSGVDSERFNEPSTDQWANHWTVSGAPASWIGVPEDIFLSQETLNILRHAIDGLPGNQRAVITLHDMEELSSQEICNILGISETNQRVLLHRARGAVRQALEDYLRREH